MYVDRSSAGLSDHEGHSNLASGVIAVVSVAFILEAFFIIVRIYTRVHVVSALGVDDRVAVVATAMSIPLGVLLLLNREMPPSDEVTARKSYEKRRYASLLLAGPAVYVGKLAILSLYYRVFGIDRAVRWQIYAIALLGLALPIMSPWYAAACRPPKSNSWSTFNPKCEGVFIFGMVVGAITLLVDVMIAVLPWPVICKLKIPMKKRIGVAVILLVGTLALVADAVMLHYRVELFKNRDRYTSGYIVMLCSFVDVTISIICSSMPAAAQCFRLTIGQTSYFLSVRSSLSRKIWGGPRTNANSKPYSTPIGQPKRKRHGPYSVDLTGAGLSTAQLRISEDVELASNTPESR